jgi:hypothetical protein
MSRIWAFLSRPENRATLAWTGAGIAAVVTFLVAQLGPWMAPSSAPTAIASPPAAAPGPGAAPHVAAPGGVAIGRDNTGGTFHIGTPPRQP